MHRTWLNRLVVLLGAMGSAAAFAQQVCKSSIPEATPTSSFVVAGDGTATDTTTGLMWKRCAEGQSWSGGTCTGTAGTWSWSGALLRAKEVNDAGGYAGHADWRLPNIKELSSLVEEKCYSPPINLAVFPASPAQFFWSSSVNAYDGSKAWLVQFTFGYPAYYAKTYWHRVRLVRDKQSQSGGSSSAPTVTTGAATGVTAAGATLTGSVSSNGAASTITFAYGPTTAYGTTVTAAQSPLAANAVNAAVSAAITGLTCNTPYRFRALGTNSVGTTQGSDATFTTAACVTTAATLQSVVSRRVHGAAGNFNLALSQAPAAPTIEPRLGPAHSLVFTFDKPVTGGTATVTAGTATVGVPTFSGNEIVVPLTGVTNSQYVTVNVTTVTTPGNGNGGVGSVRVGFLAGDVNQNGAVTLSDLGQINAMLAQKVTAANYLKDVNVSGTLSLADFGIANAKLTNTLPAP